MALQLKSTFNSCKDGDYYSLSYTCTGSEDDCAALRTFPDLTCQYQDGQLTCSNGVTCSGHSPSSDDFTTHTDITLENNQVTLEKRFQSSPPGCDFTLTKGSSADSTVQVEGGDGCTANNSENKPSSQSTSPPDSSTVSTGPETPSASDTATTAPDSTPTEASETTVTYQSTYTLPGGSGETPTVLTTIITSTQTFGGQPTVNAPGSTPTTGVNGSPSGSHSSHNFARPPRLSTLLFITALTLLLLAGLVPGALAMPHAPPICGLADEYIQNNVTIPSQPVAMLDPRGTLTEQIVAWRGMFKPPTPAGAPNPLDLKKLFDVFRGVTIRGDTAEEAHAVKDWILLGEEGWNDMVMITQEVACGIMVSEIEGETWEKHTVKPIQEEIIRHCIKRAELRVMTALKNPAKFFTKFKSPTAAVLGTYAACSFLTDAAWKVLKSGMPPGTIPDWVRDLCEGACLDLSSERLSDPENCGVCGHKCPSGTCINGACIDPSCAPNTDKLLHRCSSISDYHNTCACVPVDPNTDPDLSLCVQFSSSAFSSLTNSCDLSSDCPKGQICASFPGSPGGGKSCLDATSCSSSSSPPANPPEDIPSDLLPPEEQHQDQKPWRLRASDPDSCTDDTCLVTWSENPVHLATLNKGNFMDSDPSGKLTVNTKGCVPIRLSGEKTAPGGGGVGSIPDVTYLPKGRDIYFGYDAEDLLNSKPQDSCCFSLYDNDKCDGDGWGGCGIWIEAAPFDVMAFHVEKCGMLLPS